MWKKWKNFGDCSITTRNTLLRAHFCQKFMGCVSGGNFKRTASPQSLFNSSTFLNSLNFLVRSYHFTFPMASCCKIITENSLVGFFFKPHITVTCPRKQTHVPASKGLATVLSYIFAGRIYRLYYWNDSWDFNNGRLVLKTFFLFILYSW